VRDERAQRAHAAARGNQDRYSALTTSTTITITATIATK
jgi:hypothetical protein